MDISDSNNKDTQSYFSELVLFSCAKKFETHHIHIFVSFDVERNVET